MTPTPLPDLASPRPNGYDDLLKAGRIIGEIDENGGWPIWRMSKAQLHKAVSNNAVAFELAHAALRRDCHFPLVRPWDTPSVPPGDDRRALYGLMNGLWARETLASKSDAIEDDLAACVDLLRLAFVEDRSNGFDQYQRYAVFVPNEFSVVNNLWFRRTKLNTQQCTELAHQLWELESNRVEWETKLANEQIIVENSGFETHLRAILDRWAGINRYEYARSNYLNMRTRMRFLIVALALRACELENGRLPKTLNELCPKYLASIPGDPFDTSQPLRYRLPGAEYMLYSVGPNKIDDSFEGRLDMTAQTCDDVSEAGQFPPENDPDQTDSSGAADSGSGQ
jgi:hypothetical protein